MNKSIYYLLFTISCCHSFFAQVYPPAAGIPGTTAMYKDSTAFVNWASKCKIVRGFQDISNPSIGYATVGDSSKALGKALTNGVVSLGDGGFAICEFLFPIKNEVGFDFAVFENSFDGLFLELAFVEVSSDGINYFRFPSHSLVDTLLQVGTFDTTYATQIHNFAGKYKIGYGTPFDLDDIIENALLNKNNITHVKVIDCIGSINNLYATRDSYNNKVNEPWSTPFPSSGFDLDAIGVIHQNTIVGLNEINHSKNTVSFYPNPIHANEILHVITPQPFTLISIYNMFGETVLESTEPNFNMTVLTKGVYFVVVEFQNHKITKKIVVN